MFEAYKNTDPEYAAILEQFAGHEVPEEAGAQARCTCRLR